MDTQYIFTQPHFVTHAHEGTYSMYTYTKLTRNLPSMHTIQNYLYDVQCTRKSALRQTKLIFAAPVCSKRRH